jgi:hypothetical protein
MISALAAPLAVLAEQATSPARAPRWVLADDVRVRTGPDIHKTATGSLSRGDQVILTTPTEDDGFCFIENAVASGYVACKYLSAERVARPRAGQGGVDGAQRWVSGNSITLREAPRLDAAVVGRLMLNATVKLLREAAGSGYCEVQASSGPSGYTACRYLVLTPVILARVQGLGNGDQKLSPDYDPERVFWLKPGWHALEQYAEYILQRHPGIAPQGPWPRNDALERMKAHLALGIKGGRPQPYADWSDLKRKAAQRFDFSGESRRLQAQGKTVPAAVWRREALLREVMGELQTSVGISGPLHDVTSSDGGPERVVRLIRSLEFQTVKPSLFRHEAELAPPAASTEAASGRFDIVFRQLFTPRPTLPAGEWPGPGLYDMLGRTQALVRPIQRVQLFRDGRIRTEPSLVRQREKFWHDTEDAECADWVPGFSFGDADPGVWRFFDGEAPNRAKEMARLNVNPAASLFAFYTNMSLPTEPAIRTEATVNPSRGDTGFARGIHLYYDLDRDGIPDLAVWEGQGRGPGDIERITATDDGWYRLVLVNINGSWKVLGSDQFGYGCGC